MPRSTPDTRSGPDTPRLPRLLGHRSRSIMNQTGHRVGSNGPTVHPRWESVPREQRRKVGSIAMHAILLILYFLACLFERYSARRR